MFSVLFMFTSCELTDCSLFLMTRTSVFYIELNFYLLYC